MQKLKTKIFILSAIFLSTSIFFLQGCKDDTVTSPPVSTSIDTVGLTRLGFANAPGARANVILYMEGSLHTGYNKLYAVLFDSLTGALIEDAHVIPLITDHGLGGPTEEAPEEAINGRFPFAVVFTKSSADNIMHWSIKVGVHNHGAPGEPYGTASFGGLHISENTGKFQKMGLLDGSTLYLSFIEPKVPVTGMNNFEFLINKSYDSVYYAVDTSYLISLKPVLVSNGTVSTGNVNPVASGTLKHYMGKVNLTSTGTWRINMYMTKTGYSDSTYFEVGF